MPAYGHLTCRTPSGLPCRTLYLTCWFGTVSCIIDRSVQFGAESLSKPNQYGQTGAGTGSCSLPYTVGPWVLLYIPAIPVNNGQYPCVLLMDVVNP